MRRDEPEMEPIDRVFSTYSNPAEGESTVILGAGIVGCATAYYLSRSSNTRPDTIHLVEASPELFSSASGKSGGFCAPDWFSPATASLGELSFRLHKELAEQNNGFEKWGYSKSTASSLMEGRPSNRSQNDDWLAKGGSRAGTAALHAVSSNGGGPDWLTRRREDKREVISDEVAQVDPLRLSQFLLRQCLLTGVRLHHPVRPLHLSRNTHGELSAIRLLHADGTTHKVPCTRLILAAGAWTPSVFSTLFPLSPTPINISPLAGYSLVLKSPRWRKELEAQGCDAVFTTMRGGGVSPEIFSRVGEEIYIAGLNDAELPLPEEPGEVEIDKKKIEELYRVSRRLLGQPGDADAPSDLEVVREGLCFRPVTGSGAPILTRLADGDLGAGIKTRSPGGGVFIAAGHGPWGISLSLGTGRVVAEMIEGKQGAELSADVGGLGLQ